MRQDRYLVRLDQGPYGGWHVAWFVWILAVLVSFAVMEGYGLLHGGGPTLSDAVWYIERFKSGQPIVRWSFLHLFVLFVLLILQLGLWWLIGHFVWGLWK